jgi:PAS domain S-box-containing protein
MCGLLRKRPINLSSLLNPVVFNLRFSLAARMMKDSMEDRKFKILIVEDETIVALDLQSRLQAMGYNVSDRVVSGERALRSVETNPPDLVLMDITLAGEMDGVETADLIRSSRRIPIVFVTAHSDEQNQRRARRTESSCYLTKPYEDQELRSTISLALYKHAMEDKLKESERRFVTTLSGINEAVIVTDAREDMAFMNPAAETLTGWKQEQAVGKRLEEIFILTVTEPSKEVEAPQRSRHRTTAGPDWINHHSLLSREGNRIPIAYHKTAIVDEEGKATGAILAFMKRENCLPVEALPSATEANLDAIFAAMTDTIIVLDSQGTYQNVLPTNSFLLVGGNGKVAWKGIRDVLPRDLANEIVDDIKKVLNKQETINTRYTMEIGGQEVIFAATFSPMIEDKVLLVARDITWHRQAEQAIRDLELKYLQVINNATVAIVVAQDMKIKLINPKVTEIIGFSQEELLEKPYMQFLHPDDLQMALTKRKDLVEGKKVSEVNSIRVVDKSGQFRWLETSSVSIMWEGKPASLNFVTDVTQRKKAEKVQFSICRISEAVFSTKTLAEYYKSVHEILSELLPAKNFYIALYDEKADMLSFPYFVDEFDETPNPRKAGRGMTEYVLRTGRPFLAHDEELEALTLQGEITLIGTPSVDWLGVPLKSKNKIIGVLVIQHYGPEQRLDEEAKQLLMFVSTQIAIAIERKQTDEQIKASLREKEILLKEIHHRVKNNLQIINSLLNLQAKFVTDHKAHEMFQDSQNRVKTIALIHERLYQSNDMAKLDFADVVKSLAKDLYQTYRANWERIRISYDLDNIDLNLDQALPCGLIINELVSNSLKHAFPDDREGEIYIKFDCLEDGTTQLWVGDNGIGMPGDFHPDRSESLGAQLVRTLINQIDGRLELDWNGGTKFKITIPAEEKK